MKMKKCSAAAVLAAGIAALTGCSGFQFIENHTIGALRQTNFAEPREEALSMNVTAKSLYLRAAEGGSGFTDESIEEANKLLLSQGPIRRQVLTVVPLTQTGEKLARRLAEALEEAGAETPKFGSYQAEGTSEAVLPEGAEGFDIELISEAYVVNAPECWVANRDRWTIEPYDSVGTLGCANNANIAVMVSDPRDLLRPRALAPADGTHAARVVKDYQDGETEDLIDIDFSQDE